MPDERSTGAPCCLLAEASDQIFRSPQDGSAWSGEVNGGSVICGPGPSGGVRRDAILGRVRPRARGARAEQEGAGDDEIEEVAACLEQRRSRAVADQPVQESADEAVIVEQERRVPGR